jgi:hypothetical protein
MQDRPASAATYKLWFEFAKFEDALLGTARDRAIEWKNIEDRRSGDISWPYYYIFITSLLMYIKGQNVTAAEVRDHKKDLIRSLDRTRYNTSIIDWYTGTGKGMGMLLPRLVCNYETVINDQRVAIVSGKINVCGDTEGYLQITTPKQLCDWGKANLGYDFTAESFVFFKPEAAMVTNTTPRERKFKFGFSFEKMIASANSLVECNMESTKVYKIDRIMEVDSNSSLNKSFRVSEKFIKRNCIIGNLEISPNGSVRGWIIGEYNNMVTLNELKHWVLEKKQRFISNNKTIEVTITGINTQRTGYLACIKP